MNATCRGLTTALLLLIPLLVLPLDADARRPAAKAENKAMWNVVYERISGIDGSTCRRYPRGVISTVGAKRKYGAVDVSRTRCANGEVILSRTKRKGSRWRIEGIGSDWGADCAYDAKRVPPRILRDLLPGWPCHRRHVHVH